MSDFVTYNDLMKNGDLPCGSLIEIDRGSYKHWAYYAEDGYCYHITDPNYRHFGSSTVASQFTSPFLSIATTKAVIRKHKLKDIMDNSGSDTPSKARINNQEETAKLKNLEAKDPKEVMKHLSSLEQTLLPYHFTCCNCENYVTGWKYGLGFSKQSDKAYEYFCFGTLLFGSLFVLFYFLYSAQRKGNNQKPPGKTSK